MIGTVLCRQCFEAQSVPGWLVCERCLDKNEREAGYAIEEGKAVRRGEARKAKEEELEVSRGTVGGSQGEGQA